jgi:ATP-dependent Clp protease adapter protein ClpS
VRGPVVRAVGHGGSATVIENPQIDDGGAGLGSQGWVVTVYDNDYNTVEEVIAVLIVATGCGMEEACMETWEIHHLGRSVVHHAREQECRAAAEVIATIGIRVEVSQE